MAEVNQIIKKIKVTRWDVIKFQIVTYCFFNKIFLSDADIACLILLVTSEDELSIICNKICEMKIFKTPQSVRNSLNKMEKKGILIKNKKKLFISPKLELIIDGNILLNYNLLCVETT